MANKDLIFKPQYGVFMGRFQPFHLGHQTIVSEIYANGHAPMIFVGSTNPDRDIERNPFSFFQIQQMIGLIFPDAGIFDLPDCRSWDTWFDDIEKRIKPLNPIIYTNYKEQDRMDFTFKGEQYINSHYTEIFKDSGYEIKLVENPRKLGLNHINATEIRRDIEPYKHFLDGRIYEYIKMLREFEKEAEENAI